MDRKIMGRRMRLRARCAGCGRIIETGHGVDEGPVKGYFCSGPCYNNKLEEWKKKQDGE